MSDVLSEGHDYYNTYSQVSDSQSIWSFGQSQKALVLPLSLGRISLCCGIAEVVSSSGTRVGE